MSGLALCLKGRGNYVSGSDLVPNECTVRLERAGIPVFYGHAAENLRDADTVIISSAIRADNPELAAARERGLRVFGRAELLALLMNEYEHSVAVAGCHGKTTATAMCAHVLEECAGNCSAHIGGLDLDYGNFRDGGKKYFVSEACEYKANFLALRPEVAVILNTDADHLESYGNESRLLAAYERFASSASAAIVCAEDRIAAKIPAALTFGVGERCDVGAENLRSVKGKYSFSLRVRNEAPVRAELNVYGRHNVYNALAAVSVAEYFGYPPALAVAGLKKFRGIARRFEKLGKINGAAVIADYAHHPREIAAALTAAGEICSGKLFVVFQPHTYSRTKLLFGSFVSVLRDVENLVIYKTYPAREYFDADGSALTLSQALPNSLYVERVRELDIYLRCSLQAGDMALILGAGDIYYAAKQIVHN